MMEIIFGLFKQRVCKFKGTLLAGRVNDALVDKIRENRLDGIGKVMPGRNVPEDVVESEAGAQGLKEEVTAVEGRTLILLNQLMGMKRNGNSLLFELVLFSGNAGLFFCPGNDTVAVCMKFLGEFGKRAGGTDVPEFSNISNLTKSNKKWLEQATN